MRAVGGKRNGGGPRRAEAPKPVSVRPRATADLGRMSATSSFRRIRFRKIRIHATLQIMVKQTSGELLQREDLESCAIPEPLKKFLAEVA